MRIVLANWGSRGDIEPCVAVGHELQRRGHDVRMVVPPDSVGFAESAGLEAVACGPDSRAAMDVVRDYWTCYCGTPWKIRRLRRLRAEMHGTMFESWQAISRTLMSLMDGVDVLFTGMNFEAAAANVAEYHGIPMVTLHYFPLRPNSQLLPFLPAPLGRSVSRMFWWLAWHASKKVEDAQRRELGLPKSAGTAARRITDRGSLEIQAYDEVCFPGLAAEWAKRDGRRPVNRPFVGTLTLQAPTGADEEVASWIAAGTPPIFLGFGSIPVESPADTLAMIGSACARLGERALVGAGWSDFGEVPRFDHVKVVGTVNFATIFPACRAVVHHGGAGTTAAGLRAGVPQLILWTLPDQLTHRGAAVKRLKVGTARRFLATTEETLVSDLRTILDPDYLTRAREVATRMNTPADSVAAAADAVEGFARLQRVG
ncbi:glycosyltransferase [Mycobacterium palustre]|uniref:Glycosyl transferase family 1 n=1 Tax=Mycobacterium palustre TaxID=153971 RepID=A0A1X1ZRZ5_9MYCO|nr:glycosyltransferase [Mycobacterium palustre]MCV7101051.1 glycosyltransferase [Mycobacterium palustre]ORW26174.1 glycosyl transferase family 1 [Mycobacterium palustre]